MNAKQAYHIGVVGPFLLNYYTCFNGCAVNSLYNSRASTLEEYIPLDKMLELYE